MVKKIRTISVVIVVFALFTAACNRSMSNAPEATPSASSDFTQPLVVDTPDGMKALETSATLTAMAQAGTIVPTETQVPPDATEVTPDTGATTEVPTDEPTATPEVDTATPEPNVTVPATYTLRKGEFPYCIARRYNLNPTELLSLNGLTDADARSLSVGLELKLPQTGNPFPGERALNPHPAGTIYTVKSSDETIYSIACLYGDVRPQSIINRNGLTEPYTLTVGQEVKIP